MDYGAERQGLTFESPRIEHHVSIGLDALCELLDESVPDFLADIDNENANVVVLVQNLLVGYDRDRARDTAVVTAAYNSFRTAFFIASSCMSASHKPVFSFDGILDTGEPQDQVYANLAESAQVALGKSPDFEGLLTRYEMIIDTTGRHLDIVNQFAGYALVFMDHGENLRAIEERVSSLATELKDWNGDIDNG